MTTQMIGGLSVLHIRERLCAYDPRHPDFQDKVEQYAGFDECVPPAADVGCGCDSCFTGRHGLANALLIAGGVA